MKSFLSRARGPRSARSLAEAKLAEVRQVIAGVNVPNGTTVKIAKIVG